LGLVKVNGHSLNFRFIEEELYEPENVLIVFLHEGLGSIPQWKDFPETLCKKMNLPGFLYERYGYGKSDILTDKRPKDYLTKEGLESLPELLDKLEIKNKLILVGHSDGASVALSYASEYSENICCLIAEAPHVFIEEISVQGIKRAVSAFENPDSKLRSSLTKYHGKRTESMFYGWAHTWTDKENFDWNMEHLLAGIRCPVFVIQGKDDEYGSDKQVFSITEQVSGPSKYLLIPECGHIPHFQKSEIVLSAIESFILNYLK
jgi:pimeloyl-ACP methyl ester carboxylesterase